MRRIRISIFMITVCLICVGVVMVYSSSAMFSLETHQQAGYFLQRHLLHVLLGAILATLVMSFDLKHIRRFAAPVFVLSIVLLALVFIPQMSRQVSGARRWLRIGFFSFQPSEFAKWATILFLADILSEQKRRNLLKNPFFVAILTCGLSCALIFVQPDFGTTISLASVAGLLLIVAGLRLFYVFSLLGLSLPVIYFAIFNVPYRRRRIMAFLNPWADPQGYGFQMVQSYLALGLGGLWGVGLGQSRQKLFYLPAAHTDFIFSIIAEELGLMGTVSICLLFLLFLWQGMKVALRSTNAFIKLLSFGIVMNITLAACVHIAVVCGLVPTKGLPLPFISYGGSSLVFSMIAVGLLLNSARDRYLKESNL